MWHMIDGCQIADAPFVCIYIYSCLARLAQACRYIPCLMRHEVVCQYVHACIYTCTYQQEWTGVWCARAFWLVFVDGTRYRLLLAKRAAPTGGVSSTEGKEAQISHFNACSRLVAPSPSCRKKLILQSPSIDPYDGEMRVSNVVDSIACMHCCRQSRNIHTKNGVVLYAWLISDRICQFDDLTEQFN